MSEELRAMDDEIVVRMIVDLDARVERIEEVLPTLATKEFVETAIRDALAPLPTKADLVEAVAPLATKAELGEAVAPLATKAELDGAVAPLATRAQLDGTVAPLTTKAELTGAVAPLATKVDLADAMAEARRHFSVVGESLRADMRVLAEGIAQVRVDVGELRETGLRHEALLVDLQLQTADLRAQAADLRQQTSDLRHQTADLREQTHRLRRDVDDLGRRL